MAARSQTTKTRKSKPCSICGRWFTPHPRLGKRQKTCGSLDCKKRQKQRAQASWSKRNPHYWAEHRLKKQLKNVSKTNLPPKLPVPFSLIGQMPDNHAQDVIMIKLLVIIAYYGRMLHHAVQEVIVKQAAEINSKLDRMRPSACQDSMDTGGASP